MFDFILKDKLIYFALPILLVLTLLELIYSKHKDLKLYQPKDLILSIWMLVFSSIIEILCKIPAYIAYYSLYKISPIGHILYNQWWAWILLFFLDDFTYYWFHRKNHEVRLLWAGHVPHHSSTYMNFGTALRQGPGERLHKFFFWLWIPFLGFHPIMIFMMHSFSYLYQFWIHTNLINKLPIWVEYIFNTPAHHRIHHASNTTYLDKNHGGILIIWNRMFGTFANEIKSEIPKFGLTTNITKFDPVSVATHEYQSIWNDVHLARSFNEKMSYIFYSPNWIARNKLQSN